MKPVFLRGLVALLPAGISLSAAATLPTVPAAAAEPARAFGAAGLLQAGLGLALVLAMIFGCAWLARRFGLQAGGNGRLLKVVSSAMVGQRERVVVVEVGGQWLVLGVAAGQVRALHSMPAQKIPEVDAAPALSGLPGFAGAGAFSGKLLESLNKLKKREE
ncbi:flagellar biosynthetic protein FliO [Polaromonas sp. CF318]|uniref:flagellar biosynthetic protein FliO n=1 Tax=Polaromonas sp. CF318 TaxID=1144318 RepID=UPI000270F944|nr:flagellar biosynthetic protein FliO [Polaromonas sp. CF318]EJL88829.1 flagellar biosynthetic protein FliO [Polaromonas sp. CF318]